MVKVKRAIRGLLTEGSSSVTTFTAGAVGMDTVGMDPVWRDPDALSIAAGSWKNELVYV